jgi:glutathione S-transferase
MANPDEVVLFHSPQTRSSGALTLLEELGAPYRLEILNMKAGEQQGEKYRAINPLGKVPAILHNGALVTEQVAIYIYLADAFPKAGLAPAISDPLRGPYLRWLVYYGSCYEPAIMDRYMKHDLAPGASCPYGDFDTMLNAVINQLEGKTYLLGEKFTAADVLWGTALRWGMMFRMVPETDLITTYVTRITTRPAPIKVAEMDTKLAEEHQRAVDATKASEEV